MLSRLKKYDGGQLVIVHYNVEDRPSNFYWVYNRAKLESAKVIWADDMGPAKNQELINYFKDRRVWLIDADGNPPKLEPYSKAPAVEPAAERQGSE